MKLSDKITFRFRNLRCLTILYLLYNVIMTTRKKSEVVQNTYNFIYNLDFSNLLIFRVAYII